MIRASDKRSKENASSWSTTGGAVPLPDALFVDVRMLQQWPLPQPGLKIRVASQRIAGGEPRSVLPCEMCARPQSP